MIEIRRLRGRVALQVVIGLMTLPYLLPLVAAVRGSLAGAGWGNYRAVFATGVVPVYFRNSLVVSLSVIVIVYVVTMLAAFGFSKLPVPGKEFFFWLILAALTLPEVVLLVPLFVTAIKLGVYDSLLSVILPLAALQIPFAVLLARNFFDGLPNELLEAARIDGANIVKAFWHVALPLTRPIAAAIVVLTLINSWNSYMLPLVFLQSPGQGVVTLLPQFFVSEFTNDQTKVLASAVVAALPEVAAYLLLQKYFERGLAAGALK